MNKQAIQNTAITYWSDDDECFIVQSPLMEAVLGAGDSVEEARREFTDILSDAYEAYLEGRMSADKPGRPPKNRLALNTDVQPATRDGIRRLSENLGCSQGEVIDYLFAFSGHHNHGGQIHDDQRQQAATYGSMRKKTGSVSETTANRYSPTGKTKDRLAELDRRVATIEALLAKRPKKNKR